MAKISVIVPVYNVEKYIEKCIKSVLNQSFLDFECLIINDGTKDNSISVAKETFKDDKRFVVYDKVNGGLSDARNFGLDRANGDYIFFLDSDDYIDSDLLKLTYESATLNNSDIVCFDMMYVYEDKQHTHYSCGANFDGVSSFNINPNIIYINNSANNKLFKKEFLKNEKFIKGMWYEDLATIPIWLCKAKTVSYVSKPLYFYLQRENSIIHTEDERIFDIYKALINIQDKLNLSSKDISRLYFDNCVIMTTLRIKNYSSQTTRIKYYLKNIEMLNKQYPNWYKDIMKCDYSFKQKVLFILIKLRRVNLIDRLFKRT